MEAILPIALISLFVAANGLFVAAEFSVMLAPYPRIHSRAEEGHRQAPYVLNILRSMERRNNFIATAQIGITVASLGLGMYAEEKVAHWLQEVLEGRLPLPHQTVDTLALILAVTTLSFIHVVIGEMVPQSMAVQIPEKVVLRIAGLMRICEILLMPIARLLNGAGNLVMRAFGIRMDEDDARAYSKEEILILIEESFEGGEIEEEEFIYLENIGDFSNRTVGQVMTPRIQVQGIPAEASWTEVWDIIRQARKSRYPVFREDVDAIEGVVYYKTLAQSADDDAFRVTDYCTSALFVPSTLSLPEMLRLFKARRTTVAIVQDEFQSTDGLVTMEDLLEEIFGEIQDETDRELPPFEELGQNRIRVRGDLLLDELEQHFDLPFQSDEVDTIGGLIMEHLDRIPVADDTMVINSVVITVLQVRSRAVALAELRLPPPAT